MMKPLASPSDKTNASPRLNLSVDKESSRVYRMLNLSSGEPTGEPGACGGGTRKDDQGWLSSKTSLADVC